MPPEVEPEQPHTNEPMMRMPLQSGGQKLVSVVANPVVVVMELSWKAETRNASPQELTLSVAQRSMLRIVVPKKTAPTKNLTSFVLKMLCRLLPLGQKVENNKLKLMAASIIETIKMTSMTGLSKNATLLFLVLKPQVLHADMAWVAASNHPSLQNATRKKNPMSKPHTPSEFCK